MLPLGVGLALAAFAGRATAGGTLTPVGSIDQPIEIVEHHVDLVIQNGFARTEVTQVFFNPNGHDLEAIYRVPVPEHAALSELHMTLGEQTLHGEVVPRDRAREIYEEQRDAGSQAGLAEQQETKVFDFHVTPVPAVGQASFTYVYYERIEFDTGVGTWVYAQEAGGNDEAAEAFWTREERVIGPFTFRARIESAFPIADVRTLGLAAGAAATRTGEGSFEVLHESLEGTTLDTDLVLHYRLVDDLPGRVELVPYRADANQPGTFQLTFTPGVDLQPLTSGQDFVFLVDTSGSMKGSIGSLVDGLLRAIRSLRPEDRFQVIGFSDRPTDLTRGMLPTTLANVELATQRLEQLKADKGTNLYAGLDAALDALDSDRATSLILITDGVANEGVVDPRRFEKLMASTDVRLFGFLLGNSSNWPLMRTITEASGGFYATVSNADDVLGQVMLARSKITHEALTDVRVVIDGVRTFDVSPTAAGKLYRGEQLVLFGRYSGSGEARVELHARITGRDEVYATNVTFPDLDTDNPELERMWALDRIQRIQLEESLGRLTEKESKRAVESLGTGFSLVTDETSMLVVDDAVFAAEGIDRSNQRRTATERRAQSARAAATSPKSYRADSQRPAFPSNAPRLSGNGGGAFGPFSVALVALMLAAAGASRWTASDPRRRAEDPDGSPWDFYRGES